MVNRIEFGVNLTDKWELNKRYVLQLPDGKLWLSKLISIRAEPCGSKRTLEFSVLPLKRFDDTEGVEFFEITAPDSWKSLYGNGLFVFGAKKEWRSQFGECGTYHQAVVDSEFWVANAFLTTFGGGKFKNADPHEFKTYGIFSSLSAALECRNACPGSFITRGDSDDQGNVFLWHLHQPINNQAEIEEAERHLLILRAIE